MTTTELPVVRLDSICDAYLNLPIKRANELASLNMLPIPTFRMSDSRKAPRMVHLEVLKKYLAERAEAAQKDWEKSQA